MAAIPLLIEQTSPKSWIIEELPDGSSAVLDRATNTVYALDSSAAAALDACQKPVTVSVLTAAMRRRLGKPVTEEIALEAVAELKRTGLVTLSAEIPELENASRRTLLKAAGIAVPVILSLTAADQRAFAAGAGSGTTTTTTTAPASLASISPTSVSCDSEFPATITGLNTHFTNSSVVTFDSLLITAQPGTTSATSATSLNVTMDVGIPGEAGVPNVPNGTQIGVTVTTGSEVVTGTGFVTYTGC